VCVCERGGTGQQLTGGNNVAALWPSGNTFQRACRSSCEELDLGEMARSPEHKTTLRLGEQGVLPNSDYSIRVLFC
jgi:hypothetical protein